LCYFWLRWAFYFLLLAQWFHIALGKMAVKTTVIVEDDPETSEMLSEMMRLLGFRVHKAPGGLQAVDLIAEKTPTIVLMDQMMAEYSGSDVLGSIRMDPRLRDIPVIMISARGLPADISRVLKAGAALYLPKPVGFNELKSAVEMLVSPT